MAKKIASKRKVTARRSAQGKRTVMQSWMSSSDEAVIASLRKITRTEAAKIVKQAGIVSESGDLNPIFG
jgi:hypothetical protein